MRPNDSASSSALRGVQPVSQPFTVKTDALPRRPEEVNLIKARLNFIELKIEI